MNKQETAKIVGVLMGYYPDTFKGMDDAQTQMFVDIWQKSFADDSYNDVSLAVWDFIQRSTDDFMPRVGKIKAIMNDHRFENVPNEMEAFEILMKARCRYNIYAPDTEDDDFEKLPNAIKRAIGGRRGFISIGLLNTESESFSIEKTHFMKQYRTEIEREKSDATRPMWLNNAIANAVKTIDEGTKVKGITDGSSK